MDPKNFVGSGINKAMKLINETKQHLKNSVSNYMCLRLKFRSDALAGVISSHKLLVEHSVLEIKAAKPVVRH